MNHTRLTAFGASLTFALIGTVAAQDPAGTGIPWTAPIGGNDTITVASGSGTVVIDLEDQGVPVGSQTNVPAGVCINSGGYDLCPGPLFVTCCDDFHVSNAVTSHGYNGTTVLLTHDDLVLSRPDGADFALLQFDMSGFPTHNEPPFSVTALPSGVSVTFTPDGMVDGSSGGPDFETFTLPGGFVGSSFHFVTTGTTSTSGIFGLDNICVGPPCAISHGVGCPGEGGFVPKFNNPICDSSGQVAFEITDAPGGSNALLLFGLSQASTPIGSSGCFLNAGTLLPITVFLPLGGSGAGNGFTLLNGVFPPSASGLTVYMTAAVQDGTVPLGFTTTNGLEVTP